MTLPRKITIGGKRIRVRRVRGQSEWGCYHHDIAEIRIRSGITDNEAIDTLRHEMMHAALAIGCVSFATVLDEEAVVRCLSDEIFWPAWKRVESKLC